MRSRCGRSAAAKRPCRGSTSCCSRIPPSVRSGSRPPGHCGPAETYQRPKSSRHARSRWTRSHAGKTIQARPGAPIEEADMDKPGPDLPPDTYCYPRALRPGASWSPTPGLRETIQRLMGEGRFRSALDLLLPRLDRDPDDQEALTLALIALGHGRTQELQAVEPLGPRYLYDPRLDPVFTVCTGCGNTWASSRCLLERVAE